MDDFSLIKGRHCLLLNSKQKIKRTKDGGIFVMNKISGLVYDLPLLPEVASFFDIAVTENTSETTEVNSSDSNCNEKNDKNLTSCSNVHKNSNSNQTDESCSNLSGNMLRKATIYNINFSIY
ncbi:uncharacterized protein LOC118648869 [Monomorium pharaonis]|uniref:uncharacterized protein LOC118648869 n=1 Tax=Monomorium pharaonis TaxID=307658 RepID=UPI001746759C|nr:uncharacterized protein LOC118648869 [Monomorium pharaonis]